MLRTPLTVLLALAASLANGATLYKSIGPNGTIMFSDMPPTGDARLVEQREIGSQTSNGGYISSGPGNGFDVAAQLIDSDAVLARANAQVDQAERALAEARRDTLQPREGLRIASQRLSREQQEHIEYCKRGVKIARQQLIEILRERQRG